MINKQELQKEIEKECFDQFGFSKMKDVRWIIKKSIETTINEAYTKGELDTKENFMDEITLLEVELQRTARRLKNKEALPVALECLKVLRKRLGRI